MSSKVGFKFRNNAADGREISWLFVSLWILKLANLFPQTTEIHSTVSARFPTDWTQNMSFRGHSKRRVIFHVMDVWSVYLQTSADKRREIQCAWHPYYTDRIWRGKIRKHVKGIRWEVKDKITVSAGLIFLLASRVDAFRNVEIPFKNKSFSWFL